MSFAAIIEQAWQWGLTPHLLVAGVLAVGRCGAMVAAAPWPPHSLASWRIRAAIAILLGVAAAPTAASAMSPTSDWSLLVFQFGGEVLIGVCFGLSIRLLWSAMQSGGAVVSRMVGIRSASQTSRGVAPIGQLIALTAVASLLVAGGHRPAIGALLESFRLLPPGAGVSLEAVQVLLLNLLQASLHLSVAVAAPAAICVLLAWAAQGVLTRVVPRTDSYTFGFSGQSLALLAGTWISIGAAAMIFAQQVEVWFAAISPSLQN